MPATLSNSGRRNRGKFSLAAHRLWHHKTDSAASSSEIVVQPTGIAMAQNWRKRITWVSRSDLIRIVEGIGIQAHGYGDDTLRSIIAKQIEDEPMFRLLLRLL
jgi:hypothetical protein